VNTKRILAGELRVGVVCFLVTKNLEDTVWPHLVMSVLDFEVQFCFVWNMDFSQYRMPEFGAAIMAIANEIL
jgi:hypothetical protein